MKKHLIDSTIPTEVATVVREGFATILEQLTGYVHSMEDSERKHTMKLGRRNEGWCKEVMEVARQNPDNIPKNLNVAAIERDIVLRETVLPMLTVSRQLTQILEDTFTMAGADLYNGTRGIYKCLQVIADTHGLGETIERLSQHFAKSPREKKEPTPAPGTPDSEKVTEA